MEKHDLERLIDEGLSQRKIADRCNVSQITVRYWLSKHNLTTRRHKDTSVCKHCQTVIDKARSFCSNKCQGEFRWSECKSEIESTGLVSGERMAKKYLLEKHGRVCQNCGITHWLGEPILLIADHINGDSSDNRVTNIRLICSNCDAISPHYKGRNRGNGRHCRRQRYTEGKSF